MKYILGITMTAALLFGGCMKEDIDELRRQQAENAERIAALEEWQQTVNGNIGSLQQIVTALENMDYVTGVTPFTTPAPGGYKVTFTKSGEATIWNGSDGHTPVISVAKDTDDKYYWTLGGGWLVDAVGNKVPTTGNTPKVAIGTDGYWYVSADGTATGTPPGANWTNTNVKATGPQGDAIFAGVDNTNPDYVVFTLADGSTFYLPTHKSIGISFTQPGVFAAGSTSTINYTSTSYTAPTNVRVVDVPTGWKVTVNISAKTFTITAPSTITSDNSGEATVLVGNANQIAAMYALQLSNTGVASNEVGAVYYQNGIATGMVYNVNDGTVASGRIVSLDEPGNMAWSDFSFQPGVTNTNDGMANMQATKTWMEGNGKNWTNFPAMNWLHNTKNGGVADYSDSDATGVWYLPARDELEYLFCAYNDKPLETWVNLTDYPSWGSNNAAANTAFNTMLTSAGGTAFGGGYYRSSSEDGTGFFHIIFGSGQLYGVVSDHGGLSVSRAVAKF